MAFLAGESGAEEALAQSGHARNANAFSVQGRSAATLGSKEFFARGIEDYASNDFVVERQADRHAKHGKAVSEVRGPVEWIDIPEVFTGTLRSRAFFTYDSVFGKCSTQAFYNQLLRSPVRFRDHVHCPYALVFGLDAPRVVLEQQSASASRNFCGSGDVVGLLDAHRRPRRPLSSAI